MRMRKVKVSLAGEDEDENGDAVEEDEGSRQVSGSEED